MELSPEQALARVIAASCMPIHDAYLDVLLGVKEKVEGLDVSVNDLLAVDVVKTHECLYSISLHGTVHSPTCALTKFLDIGNHAYAVVVHMRSPEGQSRWSLSSLYGR